MSRSVAKSSSAKKNGLFARTKIYTFELLMSTIGLLVTAFVVDYGIFTIFRQLTKDSGYQQDASDFIIVIMAAMIVWLPVAMLFYLRTRGEIDAVAERAKTLLHKILVSLYLFVTVLAAIAALFYAIFTLLEFAIGASEDGVNTLVHYTLPGVLVASWHGWLVFAYSNVRIAPRRVFVAVVSTITVAVIVLLFALTATSIRGQSIDRSKEADLVKISYAVRQHYREEGQLPSSLDVVRTQELENELDSYRYKEVGSLRYELCTEFFEVGSSNFGRDTYTVSSTDAYVYNPVWSNHEKGEYCYKIKVRSGQYYTN